MTRYRTAALVLMIVAGISGTSAFAQSSKPVQVGRPAPAFAYRLLDGRTLMQKTLHGHPYVLWMVASWCSSCQTGSAVVGDHIAFLRDHGVRVVEMRLADDLGAPGPGLQQFQKAVGMNAEARNWYWGELTKAQTAALDPKGYADLYYLVDSKGVVTAVDGNPAGSWDRIAAFAEAQPGDRQSAARR
ncbi:MAG: hypothetical protein NVS4B3_22420 [Gemmatimonadaceae bacterium]